MQTLCWHSRKAPLEPSGMLITSDIRVSAVKILLALGTERLSLLRGSFDEHVIVLLGEKVQLPWIPGCVYVGKEDCAPNLYIPTSLKPNLPLDWLEHAIHRKYGQGWYVADPWRRAFYNMSQALAISPVKLMELC
jgi:hypothetical protein